MKRNEPDLREIFDRSFPMPSREQTDAGCASVLKQLNLAAENPAEIAVTPSPVTILSPRWWQLAPLRVAMALAGVLILALPFMKSLVFPEPVYSTVEKV